jgi:hypothetical protein
MVAAMCCDSVVQTTHDIGYELVFANSYSRDVYKMDESQYWRMTRVLDINTAIPLTPHVGIRTGERNSVSLFPSSPASYRLGSSYFVNLNIVIAVG